MEEVFGFIEIATALVVSVVMIVVVVVMNPLCALVVVVDFDRV